MMKLFRQGFALAIAAPLFVFLAWFFGIFMQPQGQAGAGVALVLVLGSAVAALVVFRWLARPGPKAQFRNRGVDGVDAGWGMGLMGVSQHGDAGRRRDDNGNDHFGDYGTGSGDTGD